MEEIYKGELDRAEQYEQEKGNERSLLIQSVEFPQKYGALYWQYSNYWNVFVSIYPYTCDWIVYFYCFSC